MTDHATALRIARKHSGKTLFATVLFDAMRDKYDNGEADFAAVDEAESWLYECATGHIDWNEDPGYDGEVVAAERKAWSASA